MDFSWSPEQEARYQSLLQQTHTSFAPCMSPSLVQPFWTREQWSRCGDLGLLGLCLPQTYGGGGLDALTTAYSFEAFGRGCPDSGLVFSAAAHLFACALPIAEYGDETLKEAFLPALCSGEHIGANAITEKDAGSDIFALQTSAVREGDGYILSGVKSFVSNGPVADVFVIYARTNPAHGYLGISCFVVERNTPGLIVGPPLQKVGLTSTPACQIAMEHCYVPSTRRLGKEGQGAQIFKQSMQWERACLFALYVGQMTRQLEQTLAFAQQRRQFGKAIGKYQAIAHRLVDMKLRLEAARLLLYRSCWLLSQGMPAAGDISLSKLAISEAAIQNGLDALHIHGAIGIECEHGIERMLRDALPSTIFSGTSEMQRDIIAGELGL